MVDECVLQKLEDGYAKLAASDSQSLLKKHLTKDIFDNLKHCTTPNYCSTLLDCIQSGIENLDSEIGIYAPDPEAYEVFADIFDPIIEEYHNGFGKCDEHPPVDYGEVHCFGDLDPNCEFIVSTKVCCARSIDCYPFSSSLSEEQYKEIEEKISKASSCLEGDLKGEFCSLTCMTLGVQKELLEDKVLFKDNDRFLQAANAYRFWPTGRGIYLNEEKSFSVWCNEEDHLRIISIQCDGNLGEAYCRLVDGITTIEKELTFSCNQRLGFLTSCPTNLGSTIRVTVNIKLPKLACNLEILDELAAEFNLEVRGPTDEHTQAEHGIYDISNKRRLGVTEYESVREMQVGVLALIQKEKCLEI